MPDLTEFLFARIAEDEAVARTVAERCARPGYFASIVADHYELAAGDCPSHVADYDPARVLAECEAKRRIVEDLSRYCFNPRDGVACGTCERIGCRNLRSMMLPYVDHPDYKQEWKP